MKTKEIISRIITESIEHPSNFEFGIFCRSILTNIINGTPDIKTNSGIIARELLEKMRAE